MLYTLVTAVFICCGSQEGNGDDTLKTLGMATCCLMILDMPIMADRLPVAIRKRATIVQQVCSVFADWRDWRVHAPVGRCGAMGSIGRERRKRASLLASQPAHLHMLQPGHSQHPVARCSLLCRTQVFCRCEGVTVGRGSPAHPLSLSSLRRCTGQQALPSRQGWGGLHQRGTSDDFRCVG